MTSLKGAGSPSQEAARGVDKHAKFIPGQPDMWAFVFFEALVFTSYWVVYLLFRTGRPEAFLASQADLDLRVGVFNTIVLLASSWAVARCVQASREGRYRSALTNAFLTMSLGAVFLV